MSNSQKKYPPQRNSSTGIRNLTRWKHPGGRLYWVVRIMKNGKLHVRYRRTKVDAVAALEELRAELGSSLPTASNTTATPSGPSSG